MKAQFQRLSFPESGTATQNFKNFPPLALAWCFLWRWYTWHYYQTRLRTADQWVRHVSPLLSALVCGSFDLSARRCFLATRTLDAGSQQRRSSAGLLAVLSAASKGLLDVRKSDRINIYFT